MRWQFPVLRAFGVPDELFDGVALPGKVQHASLPEGAYELPERGLTDAGYCSEDNLKNAPIELAVALGREGKKHAEVDAEQYPHIAGMAAKLRLAQGQGLPQAQVDRRVAQRLDQEPAGDPAGRSRSPMTTASAQTLSSADTGIPVRRAERPPQTLLPHAVSPACASSGGRARASLHWPRG